MSNGTWTLKGMLLACLLLSSSSLVGAQETSGISATRPGDFLRITVWPDQTLGGEFPIDADGNVYLPFLGEVSATGMSIGQLSERLRQGYQTAQRNAVVTVTPLYRIGVLGGVNRPGLYYVPPTDNIFDVINQAGGYNIRAKEDQISVVRRDEVIRLNAEEAFKTGDLLPMEALALRSGDQILVPQGMEPMRFRDWLALGNFLMTTLLFIDRITE
jgi:protein involved in polysaccharide export with SLBB domain